MIKENPPFNFFWPDFYGSGRRPGEAGVYIPSFAKPGSSGTFVIRPFRGEIVSVKPYGENPDYYVGNITKQFNGSNSSIVYSVDVSINNNAVQGDRLILAYGQGGTIQAGLIGLNVIGSSAPSLLPYNTPYSFSAERLHDWILYQMSGALDFNSLDPDYWKR